MRYQFDPDSPFHLNNAGPSAAPYHTNGQQFYGAPLPELPIQMEKNPQAYHMFPGTTDMDTPDAHAHPYMPNDYTMQQNQESHSSQEAYRTEIRPEFQQFPPIQDYPGYQQPVKPFTQQTNSPASGMGYAAMSQPEMTPFQQFDYYPNQSPGWPTAMPPTQQPMKQGGVMGYFHDDKGQLDVDKMLSTVGHMASTFQQLTPVVKSLGSLFSAFRK